MKKQQPIAPVQKNETHTLTITDLGSQGEGIGKLNGFTIFAPNALPQETVTVRIEKVRRHFAYGKLLSIETPSPERISPPCSHAATCGGCQLQHLSYAGQLAFKEKRVKESLERIGGLTNFTVQPILGMKTPVAYRNKVQMPVQKQGDSVSIGFYQKRSHRLVDIMHCVVQPEINTRILSLLRSWITETNLSIYDEDTHQGLLRHILIRTGHTTGEIMVCLILNGAQLPKADTLVAALTQIPGIASVLININRERTNVILGKKTKVLWGKATITDTIGDLQFQISAASFFQINPIQTQVLYDQVLQAAELTGTETVLDLYCGIGTISLFLAKQAKHVFGIEVVEEAVADAQQNAIQNGIHNATFLAGTSESILPELCQKLTDVDLLVVDPPRKGCEASVLSDILALAPKKIIYVSCDPATLARDLATLCEGEYDIALVQPVDMFPFTTHVECVALMSRVEK